MRRILRKIIDLILPECYFTCGSAPNEFIRLFSENDMMKIRYCPFCGLRMRGHDVSNREYAKMLDEDVKRLRETIERMKNEA